jgi:hypothetical protein
MLVIMFMNKNRMILIKRRTLGIGLILFLIVNGYAGNSPKLRNRGNFMKNLEWGKTIGGCRLSASLDKDIFKPGEEIIVTVVFENISDRELQYGVQAKDFDYTFDCQNEQGNQIPLTLFGKRMEANRGNGKYIIAQLPPQGSLVNEISASRHLDLSLNGQYTLTASREIMLHRNRTQPPVVSNTVAFKITE